MSTCHQCGRDVPGEAAFCSRCGTRVAAGQVSADQTATSFSEAADVTRTSTAARPRTAASVAGGSSSRSGWLTPAEPAGMFFPGQVVGERYRLVSQLGRGGMGEVYRADDLRLGQTVALKFLPGSFGSEPARVAAFHAEVRLSREVTHPNVCRVHDIGEVDGRIFLSMEFIDGEDLASLLRRIGRVPADKALELARQICAGLAAAHERGVLHRDLKPANVMIDGRGRARLTDFGLAALTGQVSAEDVRSGTPIYMAPEQFAGREVSAKSDIYSLGLVLYELFTGKRAFTGETLREIREQRERSDVTRPSSLVADLDPAVESVILRCLETDPATRPASAIAVAAALPGGDPLAAALAAGETPSPEMIAATGGEGALAPRRAWGLLALVLVPLALSMASLYRTNIVGIDPPEKAPEVLAERSREVLKLAGHDLKRNDWTHGLGPDVRYRTWFGEQVAKGTLRWKDMPSRRDTAVVYWYRQTDTVFRPRNVLGLVDFGDPPQNVPGSASVSFTARGALESLLVPPPQFDETPPSASPAPYDWGPLFRAAGLDMAKFKDDPPKWTPATFADARLAWTGPSPDGAFDVRVEAASYRGKPVRFEVVKPWDKPTRVGVDERSNAEWIGGLIVVLTLMGATAGAAVLARRNLKAGRCDRRGATRLMFWLALVQVASLLCRAHPPRAVDRAWNLLLGDVGLSLVVAGIVWLLYLALEPTVRRSRPSSLVAWTRLASGNWRDPLVGRDVLIGSAYGTAMLLVAQLERVLLPYFGFAGSMPDIDQINSFTSLSETLANLLNSGVNAVLIGMLMMFFISLGSSHQETRKTGYVIFFCFSFVIFTAGHETVTLLGSMPFMAVMAALYTLVFARHGLVAGMAAFCMIGTALYPIVPGTWFMPLAFVPLLAMLVLPLAGFWGALGGRSPFGEAA